MLLLPAIDIRGGRVVRLRRGDASQAIDYDLTPVEAAERWASEGAEFLHVVDLDGAFGGEMENLTAVSEIASRVSCPIQVGGGLRDRPSVEAAFDAGAERVVLGTSAIRAPGLLEELLAEFGECLVISVDARHSTVALDGWTESSDLSSVEAVRRLTELGACRFLCTQIEVDGTMQGPMLDQLEQIARSTTAAIIASGGIGSLSDLRALAGLEASNLEGVVVGRALYEGRFSVADARRALTG